MLHAQMSAQDQDKPVRGDFGDRGLPPGLAFLPTAACLDTPTRNLQRSMPPSPFHPRRRSCSPAHSQSGLRAHTHTHTHRAPPRYKNLLVQLPPRIQLLGADGVARVLLLASRHLTKSTTRLLLRIGSRQSGAAWYRDLSPACLLPSG